MQWKTLVIDSDNWVVAQHDNKEILIWATKDRPWYNIRTYNIQDAKLPFQLKTNSWTDVEVNIQSTPTQKVKIEAYIMDARLKFFSELFYRLQSQAEAHGVANPLENTLSLHEYLVAKQVIPGEAKSDSVIQYENKIRLLQSLDNIKNTVIDLILNAESAEDFKIARNSMERLFFTNILL